MDRRCWVFGLIVAVAGPVWAQGVGVKSVPPEQANKPAARRTGAAPLIPRAMIFGNPEKAGARVSPDGSKIAFLAPLNGVLNVWVAPVNDPGSARAVTDDAGRGIWIHRWAETSEHILYARDTGGDENWHVYSVDLATGEAIDLTPFENVNARFEHVSQKFPDEVVLAVNDRDPAYHDLYRVNVRTGERTLLQRNEGFAGFSVDDDFRVRFGTKVRPDGSLETLRRTEEGFEPFETVPLEDAQSTWEVGFDATGDVRYVVDSRGRDTAALVAHDLKTGQKRVIAENDKTDAADVLVHPTRNTVQAVEFDYLQPRWTLVDRSLEKDLFLLRTTLPKGAFEVTSRSNDDRYWTVVISPDNGPARTYLYDRGDRAAEGAGEPGTTLLFVNRPALEDAPLAAMRPEEIPARDGLTLVSYLTLPVGADRDDDGRPEKRLPLVLVVHGGPTARDSWGYDPEHQWLANRGYAVLSVNYRGSTGFGKKFLNAGNMEWAGKMHDDLLDAVSWAVENGIAQQDRVAIYGWSYGGYATLVGLTFTPDVFACGVCCVGPSNLQTLLESIPAYWGPGLDIMVKKTGDHRTEEGRAHLRATSPLYKVENIKRPLLIAQGANDPRVKQAESDQIVAAMQEKNIPVTYALYADEGHGFARPENRMSFYAIAEAFLAKHLGGRVEPVGESFSGSSVRIMTGADQIPGLSEAGDVMKE